MRRMISVFMIMILVLVAACSAPAPVQDNNQEIITNSGENSGREEPIVEPVQQDTVEEIAATEESSMEETTGAAVKEIRIKATNFAFEVTGPEIKKGDKVKVIVTSEEGTHGFAMPGMNVNLKPIAPGEEKVAEFTADAAGSFDYYCNVPCGSGHKAMKGTLVVTE